MPADGQKVWDRGNKHTIPSLLYRSIEGLPEGIDINYMREEGRPKYRTHLQTASNHCCHARVDTPYLPVRPRVDSHSLRSMTHEQTLRPRQPQYLRQRI